MKLLIFSDSHGTLEHMAVAVRQEHPQTVIHLGDHADDAHRLQQDFPTLPLCVVRGNCDRFSQEPEAALLHFGGKRIFAVHGHRFGVKESLLRLRYGGLEREADVILFGHTHSALCQEEAGLWMLNPGACGGRYPTYGVIEIENGRINCAVKELYWEE